jgi:twinkle protein
MNELINFKNILNEEIDLSKYMSDEQVGRVKSANQFLVKLADTIQGHGEKGSESPWKATEGKFVFRPSELTIWSGFKGHGKSLVISQVLEGFISKGENVFIISPEFPPHRVLHRMMMQSVGIKNMTVEMAFDWICAVESHLWLYDQQSSLKPLEVVALCRYAVEELNVKHILVDSLMKCGISPEDYAGQKRFVDSLQNIAHRNDVHIHLVAHARKGNDDTKIAGLHDISGSADIANIAENIIIAWRNKPKELGGSNIGEPDCIVKVEAQRNGDGWIGSIPLWFNKVNFTFGENSC